VVLSRFDCSRSANLKQRFDGECNIGFLFEILVDGVSLTGTPSTPASLDPLDLLIERTSQRFQLRRRARHPVDARQGSAR
jgi:hypothetical protein